MRCSGSSLACAVLGAERAGDVNHEWMGAVMGRSKSRKLCEAVSAEAVASAGVRRAEAGVLLGMGGYTTTTVSSTLDGVGAVGHGSMHMLRTECLPDDKTASTCLRRPVTALTLFSSRCPRTPMGAATLRRQCLCVRRIGPPTRAALQDLPQEFGNALRWTLGGYILTRRIR